MADGTVKFDAAPLATYTRNVQGAPVRLTLVELDPNEVRLDTSNPRLRYSMLQLKEAERSDAACVLLLTSQEETESLKRSIQRSTGVQEPIYVRANGVVAEGNRRLVALRALQEEFPGNPAFATIPAWLIPADTPEAVVQDLLNEIHLGSVRGWAPYEKGAQMRALVKNGYGEEEIGERYRMSSTEVRHHIAAVEFMDQTYFPMTPDPTDPAHRAKFSYFLEFFKNGRLREHVRRAPDLPLKFATWVLNEKIDTGARVRKLSRVLDSKQAASMLEVHGFEAAEACLAKEDPREQELYVVVEQARRRIADMTVDEMVELKASEERFQLLLSLQDAVTEKLAVARKLRSVDGK